MDVKIQKLKRDRNLNRGEKKGFKSYMQDAGKVSRNFTQSDVR